MNSRARIRFTTFGGRAAAGLYGSIVCRVAGSALSTTCLSCVLASLAAAAVSSSSPDAACVAGANVGICGSCAGLGSVPSCLVGGTACERREPCLIVKHHLPKHFLQLTNTPFTLHIITVPTVPESF